MYRWIRCAASLIAGVALAAHARAQTPANARGGATISGVVLDSLAHRPLAGAVVQLAERDLTTGRMRNASTDSLGRYSFSDVADGHYFIGFLHPALDSIGLEEPARDVVVSGGRAMRVDLALPSAERLRASICQTKPKADAGGIALGFVRNATTGEPIEGASVVGEWAEFALSRAGLTRTVPRFVATTAANGWFAICGVPVGESMVISATHGADSTAQLEIDVSADGFAHHDLYLGAAIATIVHDSTVIRGAGADSSAVKDSVARIERLMRTGTGHLSGVVRRQSGDGPLAGAQVSIVDGPRTRADERGAWTISNAPLGSRMLEVRAVGYYPARQPVDVMVETPPIQVSMSTLKAILDTIRVQAKAYSRERSGFQQRQRSGMGHYVTMEEILRRRPTELSDMLRMIPGLFIMRDKDAFSDQYMMRSFAGGLRSFAGYCSPSIYLDGMSMFTTSVGELDSFALPQDITGVEVYTTMGAPPRYQRAFSDCGTILVWTR